MVRVLKFGGTSVKTVDAICRAREIVSGFSDLRFVVVSAVGGVTNELVKFCQSAPQDRLKLINQLIQTHLDIVDELQLPLPLRDVILSLCRRLDSVVSSPTPLNSATRDYVLSLGEDLSSRILTAALNAIGVKASFVDARDLILTDDCFGRARPCSEGVRRRVDQIPEGLYVTQGFVGSTSCGQTTTLGRGGSDYSGALLAAACDATELLIYTDVSGVYTMDPRVVPQAQPIREITFQEMAEMANFGAKILHPSTLEPCAKKGIPIRILSTFDPEGNCTYVHASSRQMSPSVRAITIRPAQILVTMKSPSLINSYGFLSSIFSILAHHKLSVDLMTTSEANVALTVDSASLSVYGVHPFAPESLLRVELSHVGEISVEEGLSLVAVIGDGLTVPGTIQSILGLVEDKTVRLACYGASCSNIGMLVPSEEAEDVARCLHRAFIENSYSNSYAQQGDLS